MRARVWADDIPVEVDELSWPGWSTSHTLPSPLWVSISPSVTLSLDHWFPFHRIDLINICTCCPLTLTPAKSHVLLYALESNYSPAVCARALLTQGFSLTLWHGVGWSVSSSSYTQPGVNTQPASGCLSDMVWCSLTALSCYPLISSWYPGFPSAEVSSFFILLTQLRPGPTVCGF